MKLRELGEERLLAQLLPHLPRAKAVLKGVGDDCAAVRFSGEDRLLLLKTDCVVEGVHFTARSDAAAVGWKAMARPLSDFAAMSGVPQFALITLIAPPERTVVWAAKIYRGLQKAARAFAVTIVGGETSSTRGCAALSVSLAGFVEKERLVSREGGKPDDELFVTGRLGGSLGGRHLRFLPRIAEARWLTKHFRINAMMDLSDGLGADLPRLARASGVGFELDKGEVPRNRGCTIAQAISHGEDYELLFAISPRQSGTLQKAWKKKFPKLRLTRIGRLHQSSAITHQPLPRGYEHFQ